MVRELVIGSTIGTIGLLALVFGVHGYLNPDDPLLAPFGESSVAAGAIAVGAICLMIEARILIPALKSLAARNQQ